MIALIVIAVIVVLLIIYVVATYNGLISLRNRTEEAFSDIETQLKRRHDLIPNLVETVKGYASHERQTFDSVTQARTNAVNASGPQASAQAEGILGQALGRLFAVAEAYPDLKANQNFLQLQNELTDTEDKIQASRRFYNMNVRDLNIKIQQFPSSIIAKQAHITEHEFFEIENPAEKEVPNVSFGDNSAAANSPAPGVIPATPAPAAPPAAEPPAGGEGSTPPGPPTA
ncbi:MAG: LemA family protein [Thermoleophilaceae bacterium]|nr:LemA family protein [Thermoleophilaceae bacterium]